MGKKSRKDRKDRKDKDEEGKRAQPGELSIGVSAIHIDDAPCERVCSHTSFTFSDITPLVHSDVPLTDLTADVRAVPQAHAGLTRVLDAMKDAMLGGKAYFLSVDRSTAHVVGQVYKIAHGIEASARSFSNEEMSSYVLICRDHVYFGNYNQTPGYCAAVIHKFMRTTSTLRMEPTMRRHIEDHLGPFVDRTDEIDETVDDLVGFMNVSTNDDGSARPMYAQVTDRSLRAFLSFTEHVRSETYVSWIAKINCVVVFGNTSDTVLDISTRLTSILAGELPGPCWDEPEPEPDKPDKPDKPDGPDEPEPETRREYVEISVSDCWFPTVVTCD
jgi:hypothetical protein